MKRFIFVFLFLLCACAVSATTKTEVPTQKPIQWTKIRMVHSGGIMGLMRSVEISKGGHATVRDDRTHQSNTFLFSNVDLARLNELIASANFLSQPLHPDAVCADCFIYDIELNVQQGQTLHVQVNDMGVSDSGMSELIAFLRTIIDKGLKMQ